MSFVVHRTSEPRSLSPSRSSLDLSRESTPGTVRPVSVLDSPVPSPSYIPSERRSDIVGKRRSNSVVFSSPLNPRPSVSGPAPSHKTLVISPNDTATKRLSTFFTGASQMSVSMRQRLRQNSESSTIQEVMQQMELLNRDFTVQISEYQDHINNVEGQNKTLSAENEDLKRRLRKLEYERARDVRQLEARLQKLERRYTDDFANIKEVHSTKTDDLLRTIEDLAAANGVYKATLQQHRIDIPVTLAGIEANVLVLPPSTVTARRDPGRSDRDFIEQHYRTVLNRPLHSDARITTALASIDQSLELMREQLVVTSQWYGNDLLTVLTGFTNDLPGPTDQESTLAKYHAQSTSPSGSKPPSPPCTVTPPPRLPTPDPTDGSDPLFSPKFDFRVTDSEGSRRTSTGSGRSAITLSAPTKCESTGLDSAVGGQSDGGDDDEDEGQATEELDTSDGGSSDGDGDDEFPTYPFAEITERRRPRSGFQPSLLVAKLEHLSLLQTGTTEPPAVEGPVSVPGQVWIAGNGAHNSPHRAAVTPEPVISSAHLVRSGPHSPYSLPERTETGPALTVGLSPSRTNGAYVPPPDGEPVHQVPG
ncbi:hypothetical protein IWQ60_000363 [Tieghemiomyces parasiticus]|uniref:Uncharacterized protein n=1 Tax=Tieghemiomyces parasiticus TaxID=78921 RepID=A0A9W8AL88_9FUNG|nr:hypothetical protein IWQ60_000363 [Tieghemiomyces parasiticus]